MRVDIIQLSDCHFRSGHELQNDRIPKLVKAITSVARPDSKLLLVITGDIAYSGKLEEYALAKHAITRVIQMLEGAPGGRSVLLAIVPGNHDCDFSVDSTARRAVLKFAAGRREEWDSSVPREATTVQKAFFDFANSIPSCVQYDETNRLLASERFGTGARDIKVWIVNSSWASQLPEVPGSLWFPVHLLQDQIEASSPALHVLLMHHPLAWFTQECRRALQAIIDASIDVVLTGHEHITEVSSRDTLEGATTLFVEGGVLQEHGASSEESSFNIVAIDLEKNIARIIEFEFNGSEYAPQPPKQWTFTASAKSIKPYRRLKANFESYLRNAGATFRHPLVARSLELQDIYVEPDFVNLDDARNIDQVEKLVSGRELLSRASSGGTRIVIGGAEKAGKSAWCRWIFLQMHSRGFTPILIDGAEIQTEDTEKLDQLSEREYLHQYESSSAVAWSQLDLNERVLLVDDIDSCGVTHEARKATLDYLATKYGLLLITCDEASLLQSAGTEADFSGFEKYQLSEFGHRLRDALVTKWLWIGRRGSIQASAFQLLREQRVRAINGLLGKSFVPSRPIFLLTLLQSMEAGAEAAVRGSSLGEYYEYLIRHALLAAKIKPQDLDAILNYLTELGYYFVSRDHSHLENVELEEFNANFARRYALNMNFRSLHVQLEEADMIEEWNGQVRFKYRYVLLFFGARYLARHFGSDAEINRQVIALGQHLHISRYADLMLFVVHHSENPAVLDIVIDRAKKVLSNVAPLRLDVKELSEINSLVAEVPRLALKDEPQETTRERRLRQHDARAANRIKSAADAEKDLSLSTLKTKEQDELLDIASEVGLAFRLLAILGQVLRNYYGSLRADRKEQLAGEGYALVGRVLGSLVGEISTDKAKIVSDVATQVMQAGADNQARAERFASRLVFGFSSFLIFSTIKRTSELLGSDKLLITHEEVAASLDTPLSRLVRLAVGLEHPAAGSSGMPRALPLDDVQVMAREFEASPCAYRVLQRLVLDYLYMFEVSYKDKQRVCDALGISIRKQRQIGFSSQRKRD